MTSRLALPLSRKRAPCSPRATSNWQRRLATTQAARGRGRLLRFVRERATDGHYAKHLGLVASVRKDFSELSSLLQEDPEAHAETEKQRAAYERRVAALVAAAKSEKLLQDSEIGKLEESAKAPVISANAV